MEDKTITNQESLDLIARMIRNTQDRFERGAGRPFLAFGYTTVAVSLAVWYTLKATGDHHWNWLWFAIPVIGSLWMLSGRKKSPKTAVTFIDRAIAQIWSVLGVCAMLMAFFVIFSDYRFPILLVTSLFMFAGEAITGGIIKLPYIKIMGLIGIALSFGLPYLQGIDQILGFAGLFLIAMVIPGHIMNAQARKAARRES